MSEIKEGMVVHFNHMISIRPYQISSRTLHFPEGAATSAEAPDWVLYGMDTGESISSETSPKSKIIHVLEGSCICLSLTTPVY